MESVGPWNVLVQDGTRKKTLKKSFQTVFIFHRLQGQCTSMSMDKEGGSTRQVEAVIKMGGTAADRWPRKKLLQAVNTAKQSAADCCWKQQFTGNILNIRITYKRQINSSSRGDSGVATWTSHRATQRDEQPSLLTLMAVDCGEHADDTQKGCQGLGMEPATILAVRQQCSTVSLWNLVINVIHLIIMDWICKALF